MEMKKIIEKVNYYANEAKKRELTDEEKVEREKYRKLYLEQFKAQLKQKLDSIEIVDEEIEEVHKKEEELIETEIQKLDKNNKKLI